MKKKLIIIGLILAVFTGIVYAAGLIDEQKYNIVDKTREYADLMVLVEKSGNDLTSMWFNRGFNGTGDNPITQADINAMATYGGDPDKALTVAELTACFTTIQAYKTFMDAGNRTNLDKIRR